MQKKPSRKFEKYQNKTNKKTNTDPTNETTGKMPPDAIVFLELLPS